MELILSTDEATILTWLHERATEYSQNSTFLKSSILDRTEMPAEKFLKAMSFLLPHQLVGQETVASDDGSGDLKVWITAVGANVIRHHRRGRGEHS